MARTTGYHTVEEIYSHKVYQWQFGWFGFWFIDGSPTCQLLSCQVIITGDGKQVCRCNYHFSVLSIVQWKRAYNILLMADYHCVFTTHTHTHTAVSLGNTIVLLEQVQCQLNSSNTSHLIITLVVGSQCSLSLDVFTAIMKLANALLHQGNNQVQVWDAWNFCAIAFSFCLCC